MTNRPAIPIAIRRAVLLEARHRCAVCCEPTPLERAHIRSWSESKDHSVENLVALCANCHTRADNEQWGEPALKHYKENPCALAAHAGPVMSQEQKSMIDLILSCDPDAMTEGQRLRVTSMIAAYAGVQIGDVRLVSVTPVNSSRLRFEMPLSAAPEAGGRL